MIKIIMPYLIFIFSLGIFSLGILIIIRDKIDKDMNKDIKHIHLFRHTGGGCFIDKNICDDTYECECGATFRCSMNKDVHFTMPQNIVGKEEPELIEVNISKDIKE